MAYVDWIKLEHTTPNKQEIGRISELLGIDPDEAFGKVVRFWIWADQNTEDGNLNVTTCGYIDRIVSKPGFAESLISVGWLVKINEFLHIPNFGYHMDKSAKSRANNVKKVRKSRNKEDEKKPECNQNVTDDGYKKVSPSSSSSMSLLVDKNNEEENRGGAGGEDAAALLAREYHFLIPGMRKPMLEDLTPQFAEKLRVYGKDKADTIRKYIKSDTRDRTAPIWEFWKGCGLADPPKAAKEKEPHYPTPDEIEARAIRLAALPHYTAEQRKNMTQEELHADQQAYAAAYRGD